MAGAWAEAHEGVGGAAGARGERGGDCGVACEEGGGVGGAEGCLSVSCFVDCLSVCCASFVWARAEGVVLVVFHPAEEPV